MDIARIFAASILLIVSAGCTHKPPPPAKYCAYSAYPMSVNSGGAQPGRPMGILGADPEEQAGGADALAANIDAAFAEQAANRARAPAGSAATTPPEFLVLSGGSQHGAFGAGFFLGLKSVPSYDIVTGVSTGSLQSTMLFLANQPVPADRTYGWVDGPLADLLQQPRTHVRDLALAYSIAKEGDLIQRNQGGLVGGLAAGALANFSPLKARLKAIVSPDTLRLIKQQAAPPYSRRLFVGTVNLDDGRGYAIDMTELASRIDTPRWKGTIDELQDCYADALFASSSVPPGAYPVSLEIADGAGTRTNLYMDGGARFGVFLDPILRATGDKPAPDSRVDLIVNGSLYGSDWGADGKWSALTVSLRAVKIMENQVYRFSVGNTEAWAMAHGGLSMAFISNENLPAGSPGPLDHSFRGRTCAEWTAIDNAAKPKPLEFHPNYMACLSDYGRTRGAQAQWNWTKAPR